VIANCGTKKYSEKKTENAAIAAAKDNLYFFSLNTIVHKTNRPNKNRERIPVLELKRKMNNVKKTGTKYFFQTGPANLFPR
jgi:hypothetical protein